MQVVYQTDTGRVVQVIPKDQPIKTYFIHFESNFVAKLRSIELPNDINPTDATIFYTVEDGALRPMNLVEQREMVEHRRLLTNEERLLEKLKPSNEEVQKAKNTIEILSMIQEVM